MTIRGRISGIKKISISFLQGQWLSHYSINVIFWRTYCYWKCGSVVTVGWIVVGGSSVISGSSNYSFDSKVSVGGTLTYEDVSSVDSVGIITARSGIHVTGGSVGIGTDNPGQLLTDFRKRWTAKVRADGSLISKDNKGSIHSVAAALQGLPACNGWSFWYIKKSGQLISIDHLRSMMRLSA